jgi:hypothetical protein
VVENATASLHLILWTRLLRFGLLLASLIGIEPVSVFAIGSRLVCT